VLSVSGAAVLRIPVRAPPSRTLARVSLNPLSATTLAAGAVLWVTALVAVVRGRGMTRGQRWATALVLLAAPVGMVLVLR
jgi:hypothetical protein